MANFSGSAALASYGIGRQMGEQLVGQPFPGLNTEALMAGLADVLGGRPSQFTEAELRAALDEINRMIQRQQKQQASAMAVVGESFLKQNASKENITVTASGLQYEILQKGTGTVPKASSKVRVHYHGTLVDGLYRVGRLMSGKRREDRLRDGNL